MDHKQLVQAIGFLSKSNKTLAEANVEMLKVIESLETSNEFIVKGCKELTQAMKLMEGRISELESKVL